MIIILLFSLALGVLARLSDLDLVLSLLTDLSWFYEIYICDSWESVVVLTLLSSSFVVRLKLTVLELLFIGAKLDPRLDNYSFLF